MQHQSNYVGKAMYHGDCKPSLTLAICTLQNKKVSQKVSDMNNRFILKACLAPISLLLMLAGCSSVNLWPFDNGSSQAQSQTPANSTEYVCDKDRKFYVRLVDSGAAAWLILPEREVSLAKVASANGRYSNGITTLNIDGKDATLDDGPANSYIGCKASGK